MVVVIYRDAVLNLLLLLQEAVCIVGKSVSFPPLQCLLPVSEWKIYGHARFPGFVFIRNPFQPETEKYWIRRCLHDLPRHPNITNLSAVNRDDASIAVDSSSNGTSVCHESIVEPSSSAAVDKTANCNSCEFGDSSCIWCVKGGVLSEAENTVLQRLRWTTLGYHHNWDTKVRVEMYLVPNIYDSVLSAIV